MGEYLDAMESMIAGWGRELYAPRSYVLRADVPFMEMATGDPRSQLRDIRRTLDDRQRMKKLRARPKPIGPTKKRAKVKAARKANLKRTRA